MTKSTAKVVAHSKGPNGDELITVVGTFPRIILAEVNTHRMLSKNTSSSRAIPFFKMVKSVTDNPFIPYAWQAHHSGMQGTKYLDPDKKITWEEIQPAIFKNLSTNFSQDDDSDLEVMDVFLTYVQPLFDQGSSEGKTPAEWWLKIRDIVVGCAIILYGMGVTKQVANRLLEPFMWVTDIITGTREAWESFFYLRAPKYYMNKESIYRSIEEVRESFTGMSGWKYSDFLSINTGQAEIHMMDFAESCWNAIRKSTPKELKAGEWHIPFELDIASILCDSQTKYQKVGQEYINDKLKISTAICARVSYTVVGDEREFPKEDLISTYDNKLINQDPPHSSPFEHCARVMDDVEYYEFNRGKADSYGYGVLDFSNNSQGWCNNFKGFIQLRYLIEKENFKL